MHIQTVISKELEELFKEELQKTNLTKYKLTKKIFEEYFNKEESAKQTDQIELDGDFEEDIKKVDRSGIKSSLIRRTIEKMDAQKKEKNSIKKGGAFHEENCIADIASIVRFGKPNMFEIKYTLDWWYKMGVLTNVLARRGLRVSKKIDMYRKGAEYRPDNPQGKTSYTDSINMQRTRKKQ